MDANSYRILRAFALARNGSRMSPGNAQHALYNAVATLSSADRAILQAAVTAGSLAGARTAAPHALLDHGVEYRVLRYFDKFDCAGVATMLALEAASATSADVINATVASMFTDEVAALAAALAA